MTALAMRARMRRRRLLSAVRPVPYWKQALDRRPRTMAACAAGLAAPVGWLVGGPVAAVALAVYASLGAVGLLRRRTDRRRAEAVVRALDATAALAADLRAGAAPAGALSAALPALASAVPALASARAGGAEEDRLGRWVLAACAVSEGAGAPLADLLDRLALDAGARDRIRQAAAAQAAGVAATAWLLAALPLAGIGVGYGMGADPMRVLLHTSTGAACALLALALQVSGLAWSRRLTASLRADPMRPEADTGAGPLDPGGRTGTAGHGLAEKSRRSARSGRVARSEGAVRCGLAARSGGVPRSGRERVMRWGAPVVAGVATGAMAGGLVGVACGVAVAAAAARYLGRLEPAAVRAERASAAEDLPFAVDLLAAAVRAGLPTQRAVQVVAGALPGSVGRRLGRVARALALGLPPEQAWQALANLPGGGRLVAAVTRSVDSGAALSATFTRVADDQRARAAAGIDAAARRAAVLVVLPLGLCFLPAFVFAGVVPVIVAVLRDVLRT